MLTIPGVDFDSLRAMGAEKLIEINPVTGNQMYRAHSNDVLASIEKLGGKSVAAAKLGVEEIEIEHWVDDYYVPTRYAEKIHQMTGFGVWSIQKPPCGEKLAVKFSVW